MADPTGQPFSGFTQPLLVWRERELACLREALVKLTDRAGDADHAILRA